MELVGYDNLTKFQRRWVDNMIEIYPDLVSGGAITLEQCTEGIVKLKAKHAEDPTCLLYTSPSPRDQRGSRMPSSA